MLRRAALAILSATLLATAPALIIPAMAASSPAVAQPASAAAVVSGPKVVIVVGAVETGTSAFRTDADSIYAEAIKYTPNVVKVYSPNATWAAVSAAAQGASIFIYLGHGYGFPSPYKTILTPSVHDGMGLNEFLNQGDADKKYYGESVVSGGIRLAKDAIVILNHLCYAAGSSESGNPEPTIPVAKERVDNFASGFLRTGARAVMANSYTGDVISMIQSVFTTHRTIGEAWHATWGGSKGHDITWSPLRNPAYTAVMDPDTATTGFHASIVGDLGLTTDQVVAGAAVPTTGAAPDTTPPALWSVDGTTTLSPNFDGDADSLNLVARYSESVTWKATISDSTSTVLQTQTGSGDLPALYWPAFVAGLPAAEGDYTLTLKATDGAGNAAPDATVPIHVTNLPTPPTGLLAFGTPPYMTNALTLAYSLKFTGPVTGLTAADFYVTGSAAGCVVNPPTGSATSWTVTVSNCTNGRVFLTLEPGSVSDGTTLGPAGQITARNVVVDRSAPTATAPTTALRYAVTLTGYISGAVSWAATDSGLAGVATYDVARSLDGAGYTYIATGLTSPIVAVGLASGHSYRFEVRARDKAGNVGAWVAGPTLWPSVLQQTSSSLAWSGSWATTSSSLFSGGSARSSSSAGASVSYAFSGRAIAVDVARGPAQGSVAIYVDGVLSATLNTNAATDAYGWVGWSRTFSSYGSHTLKLVVLGTVGHPTITLDALEVLR
jgi:hypothetical protein